VLLLQPNSSKIYHPTSLFQLVLFLYPYPTNFLYPPSASPNLYSYILCPESASLSISLIQLSPILSYSFDPTPSYVILYPILSYPSYPFLSFPILSYPILSYPILSYPILSYPILSYHILSYPILSNLSYPTFLSFLCNHILSCLILSIPILKKSYTSQSYPNLSYPILYCPFPSILSYLSYHIPSLSSRFIFCIIMILFLPDLSSPLSLSFL
jgi:hypothetical protein